MPVLGLGTWKSPPGAVYTAVREAIRVGYRHIDCAAIYGNESEVGRALQDALQAQEVTRDELWITSKLWNDAHRPSDVGPALEKTLSDLGLDALDLYLMHWPVAHIPGKTLPRSAEDLIPLAELPVEETWSALLDQKKAGRTRQLGVSNFSLAKLEKLAQAHQDYPAVNQVELHPYLQQPALLEGCHRLKIAVTAYSPLGSPDSASMFGRDDSDRLLDNPAVARVAERHGVTPGQVLIAWALHRKTLVIPKSTNPARIRENYASQDIKLQTEDLDALKSLDQHRRMVDGRLFCQGSGYTLETLWDE